MNTKEIRVHLILPQPALLHTLIYSSRTNNMRLEHYQASIAFYFITLPFCGTIAICDNFVIITTFIQKLYLIDLLLRLSKTLIEGSIGCCGRFYHLSFVSTKTLV